MENFRFLDKDDEFEDREITHEEFIEGIISPMEEKAREMILMWPDDGIMFRFFDGVLECNRCVKSSDGIMVGFSSLNWKEFQVEGKRDAMIIGLLCVQLISAVKTGKLAYDQALEMLSGQ
jgi:hypothetical protein